MIFVLDDVGLLARVFLGVGIDIAISNDNIIIILHEVRIASRLLYHYIAPSCLLYPILAFR